MPDCNQTTLTLALLAGVIATFGPTVFMLQSRHHGIDDHERKLQEKFDLLLQMGSEKENEAQNVLDQIAVVRRRYNAALWAFILLMAQEIILVLVAMTIAVIRELIPIYYTLMVMPGIGAFGLHIFGDLGQAFKTQARSRAWLDAKIESGSNLRIRRQQ